MQMDKARKEALLDELKHYVNGKFAELEKKLLAVKPEVKPEVKPAKLTREKATKG